MRQRAIGVRLHLLLALFSLALFLPGISAIPPIDRDEARFAQASRQMLETHDYVRIRFQDETRAKKPAGIYWMQAASASLCDARDAIWSYRLPSVLGALAAVLLTFHFGTALFGRKAAFLGAALLAASVLLISEAHQAKTDAVLLACVVAAQGVLSRFYLAGRGEGPVPGRWSALGFWVAQGIGILIKGPIVPLVSLLTVAFLGIADKRLAWIKGIRPVSGLLVAALIVAPWAIAISSATGGQFIGQAVKTDLLPKLLGAQEHHGAPPGYFLLLVTACLWPASMFAVPAFFRSVKRRKEVAVRFCLAWIVPAWVLFEVVPTKLPHYVLPTYPALALLAGLALTTTADVYRSIGGRLYVVLAGLVGPALAIGIFIFARRLGSDVSPAIVVLAILACATGLVPMGLSLAGRAVPAAVSALAGAVLTFAVATQSVLPGLDAFWLSRSVASVIAPGTPVAAAGDHEPSLVFLLGTDTELTDGAGAARFLLEGNGRAAVVEAADEPAFLSVLEGANHRAERLARFDGWNYSKGKPARLSVWRLDSSP